MNGKMKMIAGGVAGVLMVGGLALVRGEGVARQERQEIKTEEIGAKYVLVGKLGKELGTFVVVEGKYHDNEHSKSDLNFEIDTVDGKKLDKAVLVCVLRVKDLPKDGRVALRGYENGGMSSAPTDPENPKFEPQTGFHFVTWFEAVKLVELKAGEK